MCTFKDNPGTVLEHVVLTVVASWAAQRRPGAAMRYVDTHAMAPINQTEELHGNPPLVTRLLNNAAIGAVAPGAPPSATPYLGSLQASAGQRAGGAADYYPTHFIHAIRAAQAAGRPINAYLFENDGVAAGRRAAITAWLANPGAAHPWLGVVPAWTATLAPQSGNFRDPASWGGLGLAVGNGDILLAFSDPMAFLPGAAVLHSDKMGPNDFNIIWKQFAALNPIPSIAVHVVFAVGGNPGAWNSWLAATDAIHNAWSAAIVGAGLQTSPPHAKTARVGVQWGGFLVVVCVWETGSLAQGLLNALPSLQGDLDAVLTSLWTGQLAFH